jgi:tetratricopeptide (TPR) repeat protein
MPGAPLTQNRARLARIARARDDYAAGRYQSAADALASEVSAASPDVQALATLGSARLALHDVAGALVAYERAYALMPGLDALLLLLGHAHKEGRRPAEAGRWYARFTERAPNDPEGWAAIAWSMRELGHPEQAMAACERALACRPGFEEAEFLRACALHDLGRYPEAARAFDALGARNPKNDGIAWNRALCRFLGGQWDDAWPMAERRHELPRRLGHYRDLPAPEWRGEPLVGRTILVQQEQGLGDQLQFLRYCGELRAMGARVVFEASPPLVRLLETSPLVDAVLPLGSARPAIDVAVHLMSLPHLLGRGADLRAHVLPPFSPPGQMPAGIAEALDVPEARVGIVWGGEPQHRNDRNRSIGLLPLVPLFDLPGIRWFSLQKGARAGELAAAPESLRRRMTDLGPLVRDFGDTAHAVRGLDLVITVDTSVAHVSASLGVPTWVLLPFVPDWRWTAQGTSTAWYPSAHLWRQRTRGDWSGVVRELAETLRVAVATAA